jgi:sugar lactone lactonase YvrE
MEVLEASLLLDGLQYAEGPRWDGESLWLSDIFARKVLCISPAGEVTTAGETPERPSGIGFLSNGNAVVVSMPDRRLMEINRQDQSVTEYADMSAVTPFECNDMVFYDGRAYVSTFGFDLFGGAERAPAPLVMVDRDRTASVAFEGLDFPNGMVVDSTTGRLIVAETRGARLTAFQILPDGKLKHDGVFAEVPDSTPDGISLDAEGAIWMGSAQHAEFLRVREGGEVTHRVPVPGHWAQACMLGGPDRQTLFMLTATTTYENWLLEKSQSEVRTVHVDVPGAGVP